VSCVRPFANFRVRRVGRAAIWPFAVCVYSMTKSISAIFLAMSASVSLAMGGSS
jgi:hypothetical protein